MYDQLANVQNGNRLFDLVVGSVFVMRYLLFTFIEFLVNLLTEILMTAFGKPGPSGFYDSDTLTRFSRPSQFGDKQVITRQDSDQITRNIRSLLAR